MINQIRQSTKNKSWYKYLDDVVENYNDTEHITTKNTPDDILKGKKYNEQKINKIGHDFIIGQKVRIKIKKTIFDKGDVANFSNELYTIDDIVGNKYLLSNGKFYKHYQILLPSDDIEEPPEVIKVEKEDIKPKKKIKKDVDESNIILDSKRNTKKVDYNKLNKGL